MMFVCAPHLQSWSAILVSNPGSPSWFAVLVRSPDPQSWSAVLVRSLALQSWSAVLVCIHGLSVLRRRPRRRITPSPSEHAGMALATSSRRKQPYTACQASRNRTSPPHTTQTHTQTHTHHTHTQTHTDTHFFNTA